MAILVDTNVVVRTLDRDDPNFAICVRSLNTLMRTGEDPVICAQVVIEFWAVVTRPRAANGMGLDAINADRYVEQMMRSFPCVLEPPDVVDRWRELVLRHNVVGKQAHDARLVAVMRASGIKRLLTLNGGHFARFGDIECVSPHHVPGAEAP